MEKKVYREAKEVYEMRFMPHTEAETFNRKEMVKALGEYLGIRPHYEGMPTKAYTVGDFTVDFEGAIIGDDFTLIREFLISAGYAQPVDFEASSMTQAGDTPVQAADVPPFDLGAFRFPRPGVVPGFGWVPPSARQAGRFQSCASLPTAATQSSRSVVSSRRGTSGLCGPAHGRCSCQSRGD